MPVPGSVSRLFSSSIAEASAQLSLRIAVAQRAAIARRGFHIVLLDPPFAYGREMVVEDALGRRSRVPFDADQVAAQQRLAS
jgi:16S rRNA G966 N2-methylase RsmD